MHKKLRKKNIIYKLYTYIYLIYNNKYLYKIK